MTRRAPPRDGCALGCDASVAREGLCARCAATLDDVRAEGRRWREPVVLMPTPARFASPELAAAAQLPLRLTEDT